MRISVVRVALLLLHIKRSHLKLFGDVSWRPPFVCLHIPQGGDSGADPELFGGAVSPLWIAMIQRQIC